MYTAAEIEKIIFEDGWFNFTASIQLIQSDTIGWTFEQLDERLAEYKNALRLIIDSSDGAMLLSGMLDDLNAEIDKFKAEGKLPLVTGTLVFNIGNKKIELTLLQFDFSRFIRRIKIDTVYN